jgi:hypothetical protein
MQLASVEKEMDSIAEERRHRFETTKLAGHLLGPDRTQITVEKFRGYGGNLPILASLASHLVRETPIDRDAVRMPDSEQPSAGAYRTIEARHPRYADVD